MMLVPGFWILVEIRKHVSSLHSQLECWNIGTLEYWVLGKWKVGLL
jgi:hypothetical protein